MISSPVSRTTTSWTRSNLFFSPRSRLSAFSSSTRTRTGRFFVEEFVDLSRCMAKKPLHTRLTPWNFSGCFCRSPFPSMDHFLLRLSPFGSRWSGSRGVVEVDTIDGCRYRHRRGGRRRRRVVVLQLAVRRQRLELVFFSDCIRLGKHSTRLVVEHGSKHQEGTIATPALMPLLYLCGWVSRYGNRHRSINTCPVRSSINPGQN